VVDTANPLSAVVPTYPVPAHVTGIVVAGTVLHTSRSTAGYASYRIPNIAPVQYSLGGSCNAPVNWTLAPAAGSINAAGLYTAPASFTPLQSVIVAATGVSDPTQTVSATITLSSALTLSLAAVAPGPFVTGGSGSFVATVASQGGSPAAGISVTFSATGANSSSATAATDANGHATFTYTGTARGTDTIQASTTAGGGLTGNALSALSGSPPPTPSPPRPSPASSSRPPLALPAASPSTFRPPRHRYSCKTSRT